MTGPSPHSDILCCRESERPQAEQTVVSMRLMAANLSFVGTSSCIALYQVDFISSDTGLSCRFFHTCFQAVRGNFLCAHFGWWACIRREYVQGTIYPPLKVFISFIRCKRWAISHVSDKNPEIYKLGWDTRCVLGVDESLLDMPVTKQVRRHITCFGAQLCDSMI
jgi:putative component of membrane protein insertase Oxa1/YidC/SpoIIIJ protein YidD